jgi:hypothetical protein
MEPRQDFLSRYGDMIDDRVAETLPELIDELYRERPARRRCTGVAALLVALVASLLTRHSVLAMCTAWLSTATVYLAATRIIPARRS